MFWQISEEIIQIFIYEGFLLRLRDGIKVPKSRVKT